MPRPAKIRDEGNAFEFVEGPVGATVYTQPEVDQKGLLVTSHMFQRDFGLTDKKFDRPRLFSTTD